MKSITRTLVFLGAGIALGLVAARMRTASSVVVAPTSAPPSPLPGNSSARASSSSRIQHSVHARDIPATDARYNPVALLKDDPDLSLKEVFESEPRDVQFAPVMEKRIHGSLGIIFSELKLDSKIRHVEIVCKTLSCYTEIEVSEGDAELVYDEINGILLGDHQSPGIAPHGAVGHLNAVTIYNVYRPETRDDIYYKRFLAEAMRVPLELAKEKFLKDKSKEQ